MKWTKDGRTVHADGSSETFYSCGEWRIESRKRAIPHAGDRSGEGVWFHTSYFLIRPDGTEKEYWRLMDAKEAAEKEAGT